ncbi:MAG: hypothetical protein U5J63_10035 [Fodinibius sp.]|nr:hypothetical protein [Fodinibius sp.]
MVGKEHPKELIGKRFGDVVNFDQREVANKRTEKLLNGESVPAKVFRTDSTSGGHRAFSESAIGAYYLRKR